MSQRKGGEPLLCVITFVKYASCFTVSFPSSAQPVLYWCSRNMSVWSNVSFNLAVLMNLLVCFFYPLEGVHAGQSYIRTHEWEKRLFKNHTLTLLSPYLWSYCEVSLHVSSGLMILNEFYALWHQLCPRSRSCMWDICSSCGEFFHACWGCIDAAWKRHICLHCTVLAFKLLLKPGLSKGYVLSDAKQEEQGLTDMLFWCKQPITF